MKNLSMAAMFGGVLIVSGALTPAAAQSFPVVSPSQIVEITTSRDVPRWQLRLEVQFGSADSEGPEQLFRVTDAKTLDSASFMIANAGTGEIRVFDDSGRYARSFGGTGKGPGEFTYLAGVYVIGDSIYGIDLGPRRINLFDLQGNLGRVMPLPESGGVRWPAPIGFLHDGRMLAINGQAFERGQLGVGLVRPPFEILESSPEATGALEVVTTFPGTQFWVAKKPEEVTTKQLLGPETIFAVGGSSFWLASSDAYRVWRYAPSGKVTTLLRVREGDPRPPTQAEVQTSVEKRLSEFRPDMRKRMLREFDEMPLPERRPVIRQLVASKADELWVQRPGEDGSDSVQWDVFSNQNRLIGLVTAPAAFRITEVTSDQVIGVWRDAADIEFVRVYSLDRR